MTVHKTNDSDVKVKEALDIWAHYQKHLWVLDLGVRGSSAFNYGGGITCYDDFETKVDKNLAINIEAILGDLSLLQKSAINHFHLSAVWSSQGVKIDDVYEQAIIIIKKALLRRGLL
jgi:hypothetical protein